MDRKHFLKGSEAREQALSQRNLATQTRLEVTPFINTQTAASSRTICLSAVQLLKKRRCLHWFFVVIWSHLCVCFQPKGEVSQDMRYPICLIRHLFLNRPHLHSLPRSIHKKYRLETTACPGWRKQEEMRLCLFDSSRFSPFVLFQADTGIRSLMRNVYRAAERVGPQTCLYGTRGPAWKRLKLKTCHIVTNWAVAFINLGRASWKKNRSLEREDEGNVTLIVSVEIQTCLCEHHMQKRPFKWSCPPLSSPKAS